MSTTSRYGEYSDRGDYHRELNPKWSYYPIYVRKMAWIETFLNERVPKSWTILDAGCGEGLLVEKFAARGYKIIGVDLNYGSALVHRGDICRLPFSPRSFEAVFCLDVIEHLELLCQETAFQEVARVLKQGGWAIITVPNLAHLQSRWRFLRYGELARTAQISKHPGDRPIKEYLELIKRSGFEIAEQYGIKMTLPKGLRHLFGSFLSQKIMFGMSFSPSLCFLNLLLCRKISAE